MTPTDDLRTQLRAWISERIPAGGTEADTLFTNAELDVLLLIPSETLEEAAYRGWLVKAGEDRDDVIERSIGSERLRFVDPTTTREFALKMADYYYGLMPGDPLAGSQVAEMDPPDVFGTKTTGAWDMSRVLGYE